MARTVLAAIASDLLFLPLPTLFDNVMTIVSLKTQKEDIKKHNELDI